MKKRLAITPGEPSGVGPELMYYVSKLSLEDTQLVLVASKELIKQRVSLFDTNVQFKDYDVNNFEPQQKGSLTILDVPLGCDSIPGKLDTRNAKYVLNCLDIASD